MRKRVCVCVFMCFSVCTRACVCSHRQAHTSKCRDILRALIMSINAHSIRGNDPLETPLLPRRIPTIPSQSPLLALSKCLPHSTLRGYLKVPKLGMFSWFISTGVSGGM